MYIDRQTSAEFLAQIANDEYPITKPTYLQEYK
jgi:hypothetical protein